MSSGTRLYVGNLSPSVDEYTLMQVCSKVGKIAKLDYLFHKTGPLRGKPRGYAFVEYATPAEAQRAVKELDQKLVRGRKMTVTTASEQQTYQPDDSKFAAGKARPRPGHSDANRPTPISLLKGNGVANASTSKKIAALEAKLAALRQNSTPTATPSPPPGTPKAGESGATAAEEFLAGLNSDGTERKVGTTSAGAGGSVAASGAGASGGARVVTKEERERAGLPQKPLFEGVDDGGSRR